MRYVFADDGFSYPTLTNVKIPNLILTVFRGAYAEGANFKGDSCRAVICVGIPIPPSSNSDRVSVNYHDAFVSLNQALGRVIRDARDWGAMILLDSRFGKSFYFSKLPQWIRELSQPFPQQFQDIIGPLKEFIALKTDQLYYLSGKLFKNIRADWISDRCRRGENSGIS